MILLKCGTKQLKRREPKKALFLVLNQSTHTMLYTQKGRPMYKDEMIALRLTTEELDNLKKIAEDLNISLSGAIRLCIKKEIKKERYTLQGEKYETRKII